MYGKSKELSVLFKATVKLFSYQKKFPYFCIKKLITLSRVRKVLFKYTFFVLMVSCLHKKLETKSFIYMDDEVDFW